MKNHQPTNQPRSKKLPALVKRLLIVISISLFPFLLSKTTLAASSSHISSEQKESFVPNEL